MIFLCKKQQGTHQDHGFQGSIVKMEIRASFFLYPQKNTHQVLVSSVVINGNGGFSLLMLLNGAVDQLRALAV